MKWSWQLKVGGFLIFSMALIAVLAPFISPFDPTQLNLENRFLPPNSVHLFGTDQNGADILSEVFYGARVSLTIAFSVVSITLLVGLVMGSLAGYIGGLSDLFIMRFVDMIFGFPGFLLILAIVAILQEASVANMIFALCLTGWASYARLVRGEILHLKEKEHVLNARALGLPHWRILIFHIWPNLVGPLVIQASFSMAVTIITESSLSFLGLGVSPKTPTWGSLLGAGRQYLIEAPYLSFFPGMFIVLLVLGFNLVGDGLRESLDPKK
jgi:peptide/nickel transport system permease protein